MKYQEKKIEGFNILVTTDGRILNSLTRKERKPKITKTGYLEIGLYSPKISLWKRIHRLVAEAFIPNPENKPFVNHKDGNKINNCVENLEWVTHQENMEHAKTTV